MNTSANNLGVSLLILVVMTVFTLRFGSLMLRTVDVIYNPSVKKWMSHERQHQQRKSWKNHMSGIYFSH